MKAESDADQELKTINAEYRPPAEEVWNHSTTYRQD